MVPNPLHRAQLVVGGIGVAMAVAAILAVDADAAQATLLVLGAFCVLLGRAVADPDRARKAGRLRGGAPEDAAKRWASGRDNASGP